MEQACLTAVESHQEIVAKIIEIEKPVGESNFMEVDHFQDGHQDQAAGSNDIASDHKKEGSVMSEASGEENKKPDSRLNENSSDDHQDSEDEESVDQSSDESMTVDNVADPFGLFLLGCHYDLRNVVLESDGNLI